MGLVSGHNGSADTVAANNETARQQAILKSTGQINNTFDAPGRQQQYADYGSALKQYYNQNLNQQRDQVSRGLKFALARTGLTGGGTAADEGRLSAQDYIRGLLGASNAAQNGVAGLRAKDEATRAQLISLAQSGNSVGNPNAFFSAASGGEAARAGAVPNALGDAFGDVASFINNKRSATEQRTAATGIWG